MAVGTDRHRWCRTGHRGAIAPRVGGMTAAIPIRAGEHDGHVLITGGAGFLGTNIADALAGAGQDVLIFDNLSRNHVRENLAWITARHPGRVTSTIADVRDSKALRQAVRGARAV